MTVGSQLQPQNYPPTVSSPPSSVNCFFRLIHIGREVVSFRHPPTFWHVNEFSRRKFREVPFQRNVSLRHLSKCEQGINLVRNLHLQHVAA